MAVIDRLAMEGRNVKGQAEVPDPGMCGLGGFQALQAFLGDARKAGVELSEARSGALLLPFRELFKVRSIRRVASVLLS